MVDLFWCLIRNPSHMLLGSASIALWFEGSGRISHYCFWRSSIIKTICLSPQLFLSSNINYQQTNEVPIGWLTTQSTSCYWAVLSQRTSASSIISLTSKQWWTWFWCLIRKSKSRVARQCKHYGSKVLDVITLFVSCMLLGSASTALWFEGSGLDVVPTIIFFFVFQRY